jgi:hypothetical protein
LRDGIRPPGPRASSKVGRQAEPTKTALIGPIAWMKALPRLMYDANEPFTVQFKTECLGRRVLFRIEYLRDRRTPRQLLAELISEAVAIIAGTFPLCVARILVCRQGRKLRDAALEDSDLPWLSLQRGQRMLIQNSSTPTSMFLVRRIVAFIWFFASEMIRVAEGQPNLCGYRLLLIAPASAIGGHRVQLTGS